MLDIRTKGHDVEKVELAGSIDYITTELVYIIGLVYGAMQISDPQKADLFKQMICTVFGSSAKDIVFNDSISKIIKNEDMPVKVVLME